ncbi:hypothetical protein EUX98_g7385 [Antrodiella citrinella]|uniref:Uncharacterized protein n=1 Tax=Antrodiella citrinella TaxID=2447956 RepID=A0A4S4MLN9_9APHY|nr:hypothetical protein EUX98_g7385 [Antrodiella citrinella]
MVCFRFFTRESLRSFKKKMSLSRKRLFARIAEKQRVAQIKVEVQQKKERAKATYIRYPDGELWIRLGGVERRVKAGEEPQEGDEIEEKEDNEPTEPNTPVARSRNLPNPPPTKVATSVDADALTSCLQSLSMGTSSQSELAGL